MFEVLHATGEGSELPTGTRCLASAKCHDPSSKLGQSTLFTHLFLRHIQGEDHDVLMGKLMSISAADPRFSGEPNFPFKSRERQWKLQGSRHENAYLVRSLE